MFFTTVNAYFYIRQSTFVMGIVFNLSLSNLRYVPDSSTPSSDCSLDYLDRESKYKVIGVKQCKERRTYYHLKLPWIALSASVENGLHLVWPEQGPLLLGSLRGGQMLLPFAAFQPSRLSHRSSAEQLVNGSIQTYICKAYNFCHRSECTVKCPYDPSTNWKKCRLALSSQKGTYAWCTLVASPAKWSNPSTGCVTSGYRVANWLGPKKAKAPVEHE